MYRPAVRATPKTIELCDYVCYQCRHKTTARRRNPVVGATQVRRESTQTSSAQVQDVDDWINNFNSFEGKPPKANSPPRTRARRARIVSSQQHALGGSLSKATGVLADGSQREGKPDKRPKGENVGHHAKALDGAISDESKPNSSTNFGTSSFRRAARRAESRAQRKRLGKKGPRRRQDEETAPAKVVDEPVDYGTESGGSGAATQERAEFEHLLAGIRLSGSTAATPVKTPETTVEAEQETPVDDIGLLSQLSDTNEAASSVPVKRIERPDFPFPAVARKVMSTATSAAASMEQANLAQRAQPEATQHTSDQQTPAPVAPLREYSFAKKSHPFSIATKVKESQTRPMWGGVPRAPTSAKPTKISFDSLAAADAVSAKAKARTAGESTAWGCEPVKSTHAMAEQTTGQDDAALGDPLMDQEFADKHATKSKLEEQVPAGVLKAAMNTTISTIEALREKLGLRLPPSSKPSPGDGEPIYEKGNFSLGKDGSIKATTPVDDEFAGNGVETDKHAVVEKNVFRTQFSELKSPQNRGFFRFGDARSRNVANAKALRETAATEMVPELGEDHTIPEQDDASSRLAQLYMDQNGVNSHERRATEKPSAADQIPVKTSVPRKGGRKNRPGAKSRGLQGEKPSNTAALSSTPVTPANASASAAGDGAEHGTEDHISLQAAMSSLPDSVDIPAEPSEDLTIPQPEMYEASDDGSNSIGSISTADLEVTALNIEQPPVPPVQYGLDRVLFNPGVYQLQDPQSRVYNFDPYLQEIMPITEFDFNALKEYKTSSQDVMLAQLAHEHSKKYVGSTSSMTSALAHFHYLLSNWRPLNLGMLSKGFKEEADGFTLINRAPNAIFLRYKEASGTYAIDADKEHDSPNVLMMLGKSMEKLLTAPKEEYERHRLGNTTNPITQQEKEAPEAFEYTTMGDFLMRSQLDAHDPRLPGTGMFDLKTRACLSVRMDAENYKDMLGYEILTLQGRYESYEREYYDMMRSTMLKYMLQARMGRMDGIFVAYHNIERIFGFQYLPISDIDRAIHGQIDPCLGDQEFRFSLKLMNEALEAATKQFPGKSLRVHFECVEKPQKLMWIFAEPMEESEIKEIQSKGKEKIVAFEAQVMGLQKKEEKPMVDVVPAGETEKATDEVAAVVNAKAEDVSAATTTEPEPVQMIQEAVDYNSTTTPADPKFYSKITLPSDENLKPLFAATLIVQNLVDGEPCEGNRPSGLKRDQTWEVQYIMKEADISLASKWARYEDCKTRRRMTFAKAQEKDDDALAEGAEPKKDKRDSGYFKMLREMVERGRRFRKLVDRAEAGKEKVVLGQVAEDVEAEKGVGKEVKDVAGYMKWLYSNE